LLALIVRALARLLLRTGQDGTKDLEILVLQHQLRVLHRKIGPPKFRASDRVLLAVASRAIPRERWVAFLVTPATLQRWHRELVKRKWSYAGTGRPGRPPIDPEVRELIVRLARENPRWGCVRIGGELRKLGSAWGHRRSAACLGPPDSVPPRGGRGRAGPNSCAPKGTASSPVISSASKPPGSAPLYIFLFIELGSRRIHVSPSTAHPDAAWITQQARNLVLDLDDRVTDIQFLIHDRDTKLCRSFDEVFRSEGATVILTPIRAPNANGHAERAIETIRAECLDWTLILGRRHLDRTLRTYAEHYNRGRPHRALALATPLAEARDPTPVSPREVRRRDLLGGLIHEYHGIAA
jgi:putative transposase